MSEGTNIGKCIEGVKDVHTASKAKLNSLPLRSIGKQPVSLDTALKFQIAILNDQNMPF